MKAFVIDLCTTLKVDSKGRVVIPTDLRRYLRIGEGDELELMYDPNKRRIVLQVRFNPDAYEDDAYYTEEILDDVHGGQATEDFRKEMYSGNNQEALVDLKKLKQNLKGIKNEDN